jgi:hypothetical protein
MWWIPKVGETEEEKCDHFFFIRPPEESGLSHSIEVLLSQHGDFGGYFRVFVRTRHNADRIPS